MEHLKTLPTHSESLDCRWLGVLINLLSIDTEVLRYIWRRGTVGGGAITIWVNKRDIAWVSAWPTTCHVDGRSDRDIGRDLDLEWSWREKSVASDEIYSLLGSDICWWVNLGNTGQVGDVQIDKYVGLILRGNLVCVCVCVSHDMFEQYHQIWWPSLLVLHHDSA